MKNICVMNRITSKALIICIFAVFTVVLVMPGKNSLAVTGDKIDSVSLGGGHSAAIDKNGTLWMWGGNYFGQIGDGTTKDRNSPVKIMEGVAAVSLGEFHSAAIKNDGSLWMWGDNEYGQLGNGTTIDRHSPVKIMDNVASVSLGYGFSAAIKKDGSLWMWGANYHGALGDGTGIDRWSPVKIMDHVVSVSLGGSHSAAIKDDGSLWMWGCQPDNEAAYEVDSPIKIMDEIVAVSLGYDHTAVIKTDGSLWMWGSNCYGQLGDETCVDKDAPVLEEDKDSPVKVLTNVASVSLGAFHSAAIKDDGSLWMWGSNYEHQLIDYFEHEEWEPVKCETDVVSVSLGRYHSSFVKKDGSLWIWGENEDGQVGNGTKDDIWSPIERTLGEDSFFNEIDSSTTTTYNPKLASMLMQAANEAYKQEQTVQQYLERLGLDYYECYNYYEDPFDSRYQLNSVAYSIGYKDTSEGRIVTIFIRGSYGSIESLSPDWISNLCLGATVYGAPGWHSGFDIASLEVYNQLSSMGLLQTEGVKYVITGHSRGAGVANLLAVRLNDAGVPQSNVFDYNFACPDTNNGFPSDWNPSGAHDNIFNIGICGDIVTKIPGVAADIKFNHLPLLAWGKYGRSVWYADNWNNFSTLDWSFASHDQELYVSKLNKKKPFSYYKTWDEMNGQQIENQYKNFLSGTLSIFSCPVNVIAKDRNGQVLASVVNDIPFYSKANKGKVIVVTYGDSKWFMAKNGVQVKYEVTGTDAGKMQYESYRVDRLNELEETISTCADVSLEAEKEFLAVNNNLFVTDKMGSVILDVQEDGTEVSHIHKWNDSYTVDKKATYAAKGSKSIHCAGCDEVKPKSTVVIPKLKVKPTSMSKLTPLKKGFKVKWKKVSAATGYEIQYALNSRFTKSKKTVKIKKAATVSKKVTKLIAKKKYYIRVRAYKTVSGKKYYSAWCKKKTVTTKN